jgi:REP element-mobilizing transposase RayT
MGCRSFNHTRWERKYHGVFMPKCRRKGLYGELHKQLGPLFQTLAEHEESSVEEGHRMPDHVHLLLSIPYHFRTRAQGRKTGWRDAFETFFTQLRFRLTDGLSGATASLSSPVPPSTAGTARMPCGSASP